MARTLTLSMLNITLPPPHERRRYIDAMQHAYQKRRTFRIRGDLAGTIGTLRADEADPSILVGEIYKFMDLQSDRGWFDVLRREPAQPQDLAAIQIPEHLKPHFQFLPFLFFASCHRLVMVSRDGDEAITPHQAKRVIEAALRAVGERPDVTIEPSRDALDRILSLPRLRSLKIEITPPNPDDNREQERALLERLKKQNAARLVFDLKARDGSGLLPDEDTRGLARIAQSNGKVVGKGGERGKSVTVSTEDHPLEEKVDYDPNTELRGAVLLHAAPRLLRKLGLLE